MSRKQQSHEEPFSASLKVQSKLKKILADGDKLMKNRSRMCLIYKAGPRILIPKGILPRYQVDEELARVFFKKFPLCYPILD